MFKYTREQLLDLKKAADTLRKAEKSNIEPLTEELYQQLKARIINSLKLCEQPDTILNNPFIIKYQQDKTIDDILFDPWQPNLCGCLGPIADELYCSCKMNMLKYEYRYDIALKLLEEQAYGNLFYNHS